jgi:hypothetical protein
MTTTTETEAASLADALEAAAASGEPAVVKIKYDPFGGYEAVACWGEGRTTQVRGRSARGVIEHIAGQLRGGG